MLAMHARVGLRTDRNRLLPSVCTPWRAGERQVFQCPRGSVPVVATVGLVVGRNVTAVALVGAACPAHQVALFGECETVVLRVLHGLFTRSWPVLRLVVWPCERCWDRDSRATRAGAADIAFDSYTEVDRHGGTSVMIRPWPAWCAQFQRGSTLEPWSRTAFR